MYGSGGVGSGRHKKGTGKKARKQSLIARYAKYFETELPNGLFGKGWRRYRKTGKYKKK